MCCCWSRGDHRQLKRGNYLFCAGERWRVSVHFCSPRDTCSWPGLPPLQHQRSVSARLLFLQDVLWGVWKEGYSLFFNWVNMDGRFPKALRFLSTRQCSLASVTPGEGLEGHSCCLKEASQRHFSWPPERFFSCYVQWGAEPSAGRVAMSTMVMCGFFILAPSDLHAKNNASFKRSDKYPFSRSRMSF